VCKIFAPEKKGWLMDESAEAFLNLFPQEAFVPNNST